MKPEHTVSKKLKTKFKPKGLKRPESMSPNRSCSPGKCRDPYS